MPVRAITPHSVAHPPPQLFWNGVEGAKGFAKRSTWWDMLFMGIRGIGPMMMIY